MHQPMRRRRQLLPEEETVAMLDAATSGVLAVMGEDGYPYAVPLSFAYEDGSLYFHSSRAGHKLDAIAHSDKASFCVIADDDVVQSTFTTHFRSVIVFGRIGVLSDDERRRHALMLLAEKYSPDYLDDAAAEIERSWNRMCVLELVVEEMTGKAAIEIIEERDQKAKAAE
ncbi:MAG: pyridoxamine 5'-phosphate oxidase family protein [Clostridiales bacterium]|nr:pyridoxamine 5'-phosphate oxidase family protein [Clostridiales bacterium]